MQKGLIVSIQGYSVTTTEELLIQAINGGAIAVRTDKKIKSKIPIIGLYKIKVNDRANEIYITPTIDEITIVNSWANYVAVDCRKINTNLIGINEFCKKKNIKIIADIRNYEDYENLKNIGFQFEYITTALSVYDSIEPNMELIEKLIKQNIKVIAEGNYITTDQIKKVIKLGVNNVCIGGAITGIYELTRRYANACIGN